MIHRILILDTPNGDLAELCSAFRLASGETEAVEVLKSGHGILARLTSGLPYDLVVLDTLLGDGNEEGEAIIKAIRERDRTVPVIAVEERGDVSSAARAIAAGATDYLVRGGQLRERVTTLLAKVRALLELVQQNRVLGEQNRLLQAAHRTRHQIVGTSPQIGAVIDRIGQLARIPRPILITGERGTGKELVARAIHSAADDSDRPFVAVNCAAFSDALLESELFGHERGAFTGADHVQHGKFEQANGGTLFLDEIGNMSLAFQQKILRVVEYEVFTRVGGRDEIQAQTRIVAATNSDLDAKMRRGEFLPDLYDRLTFEILAVPPLRERDGDVPFLAQYFLDEFMREIPALGGKRLSRSAVEALQRYDFPGNVRELKNIVERAAYRGTTNEITPEDIGLPRIERDNDLPGGTFKEKIRALENRLVRESLAAANGNQAEAARRLGLTYHQFRYHFRKLRVGY